MKLKNVRTIIILLIGIHFVLLLTMALTHTSMFGDIATAIVGVYGIFLIIFWRCPKCGKNLGPLWAKRCRNCGEDIS